MSIRLLLLSWVFAVTPAWSADEDGPSTEEPPAAEEPADPSEAPLFVERARVALEWEDTAAAIASARRALQAAPEDAEAASLLVEALLAGGLAPWALGVAEVQPAPWLDSQQALQAALSAGDEEAAMSAATALQEGWPDRPDLLAALFEHGEVGRKVDKLRQRAASHAVRTLRRSEADAVWTYRARRLLRAAGDAEGLALAADVLAAAGEPRPALGVAPTRFELLEEGRRQALAREVALPTDLPPSTLPVLVEKLAADALAARDGELALSAWQALRQRHDSAEAALGAGQVLLGLGRHEDALAAADDALTLAVDPDPADLAVAMEERHRHLASDALLLRARALDGLARIEEARIELAVAELLAEGRVDSALADRLAKLVAPAMHLSPDRVLAKVALPVEPDTADSAATAASAALAGIAVSGSPEVWRGEAATAHRLLGAASEGAQARIAWRLASLIEPTPREEDHRALAALHEAAGHLEAAFRSWAIVAAYAPDDPAVAEALERTWTGVGEAHAAALSLTGDLREALEAEAAAAAESAAARRPARSTPPAPKMVAEGEPIPPFSLFNDAGTVTDAVLRGRVVVLTFFDADCVECLGMLHDFGSVARGLRTQGRDVVVIGVSTDGPDRVARFEHVARIGQRWGELYRSPELAESWGVQDLPVAYLVDVHGTVRSVVRHWLGRAYLERQLRRAIQE